MRSEEVTIRRATIRDGEVLAEMRVIMLVSIFGDIIEEEVERKINLDYFRGWDGEEPFCLIAEAGGRVAGSVTSSFYPHFPSSRNPTGKLAMVHNLCVFEEFRGRGIGRSLMRAILAECRDRNVGRVNLNTSKMGRGLYESFGFREEPSICPEMRLHQADLEKLEL